MIVIVLLLAAIFAAALGLFSAVTFKVAALVALACIAGAFAAERIVARSHVKVVR